MDSCRDFWQLAALSSDNALTPDEKEVLENHLSNCLYCAHLAEFSRNLSESLPLEKPPENLASGILYKIELEPVEKGRWRNLLPKTFTLAAACVVVALLYLYTSQQDSQSDNNSTPEARMMAYDLPEAADSAGGSAVFIDGSEAYCGVLIQYGSPPESSENTILTDGETRVIMGRDEFEVYKSEHPEAIEAEYQNISPDADKGMIVFYRIP